MQKQELDKLIERLDQVLTNLRHQNSGADIIDNIRNTAILLKEELEEDPTCIPDCLVREMVFNVENSLVNFYMAKYPGRNI